MALAALTLSVAIGYSGYSFRSKVNGITAGSEVVLQRVSGDGVGYANGFVRSEALPTDDAIFQLTEFLPSTGERRTTQLKVATVEYHEDAAAALAATPGAAISPAGVDIGDGSFSWGAAARNRSAAPVLSGGASTPTLQSLSLSASTIAIGVATTINIVGAASGSTITVASGAIPTGMTLNSAARTIAGTPTTLQTVSPTLRETLAGATGSPKDTALGVVVADQTAPTLTSPTDAANGATAAAISVSTNEATGTLYWFVSASATPPSAAALKAGTGAVAAGNQTVSGTGVQSAAPSGLVALTAYYTYFLHRDAAGNDSAIAAADGFTTGAAETYTLMMTHGDSKAVGVQSMDGSDGAYPKLTQHVKDSGFSTNLTPIYNPITGNGGTTNPLSPFYYSARKVIDALGWNVDYAGGGWNGQALTLSGNVALAAGGSTTAYNITNAGQMYTERVAANPGATIRPIIMVNAGANDAKAAGVVPADLQTAFEGMLPALRTATGFSGAPIVVVGQLPAMLTAYGALAKRSEAGIKAATLKTANAYYSPPPATVDGSTTIGTGNGSTATFTATIYYATVVALQSITVGGTPIASLAWNSGTGAITGTGISSGNLNAATGALTLTFTTPPANGQAIIVNNSAVTTTDNLHESNQAATRKVGYDYYGASALIAFGQMAARTPNFSFPAAYSVEGGSAATLDLTNLCDQPIYYTGVTVGGSLAEISGDTEFEHQVLRPVGGTWPAYDAGTPANNSRTVSFSYITGDRVTGTITLPVTIEQPSNWVNVIFEGYASGATNFTAVVGKTYAIITYGNRSGILISDVGSVSPVASGTADTVSFHTYTPTTGGTKTITPAGGNNLAFIVEITGRTANGSNTGVAGATVAGPASYTSATALTGGGLFFLYSATTTGTCNMVSIPTAGAFYLFYSNSTVTPAGVRGGATAYGGIGYS